MIAGRRRRTRVFVPATSPGGHGPGPVLPPAGRPGLVRFITATVLLFVVCTLLAGCGPAPSAAPATSTVPATVAIGVLPPEFDTITTEPTTASSPAGRVSPPSSVEIAGPSPFDPVAYVNGLSYGWTWVDPAMEAFRVVALTRGWDPVTIELWSPFAADVIAKEGVGCPNAVGGDVFEVGTCDPARRTVIGHGSDSGFGQVTPALYGRTGLLCVHEGICSQAQVIGSPFVSMVALVATFELAGRFPWCDYEGVPQGWHDCTLIPRDARP